MTQVLASICIIEKKLFMKLNASAKLYADGAMEIKSVESFLVTGTKVEEQDFSYLTQIYENLECLSFCGFLQKKPSRGVLRKGCFEYTVFSRLEAVASICFLYVLVRFLFEGGFYSRAASIYSNSPSVIHQMTLFRNFFFTSRVIM